MEIDMTLEKVKGKVEVIGNRKMLHELCCQLPLLSHSFTTRSNTIIRQCSVFRAHCLRGNFTNLSKRFGSDQRGAVPHQRVTNH